MKREKTKGITLIALVITIIILVILATVTITLVLNNNGIFKQAEKAKINSDIAQEKEFISLGVTDARLKSYTTGGNGSISKENLQGGMDGVAGKEKTIVIEEAEGNFKVTYSESGREYIVTPEGTFTEEVNTSNLKWKMPIYWEQIDGEDTMPEIIGALDTNNKVYNIFNPEWDNGVENQYNFEKLLNKTLEGKKIIDIGRMVTYNDYAKYYILLEEGILYEITEKGEIVNINEKYKEGIQENKIVKAEEAGFVTENGIGYWINYTDETGYIYEKANDKYQDILGNKKIKYVHYSYIVTEDNMVYTRDRNTEELKNITETAVNGKLKGLNIKKIQEDYFYDSVLERSRNRIVVLTEEGEAYYENKTTGVLEKASEKYELLKNQEIINFGIYPIELILKDGRIFYEEDNVFIEEKNFEREGISKVPLGVKRVEIVSDMALGDNGKVYRLGQDISKINIKPISTPTAISFVDTKYKCYIDQDGIIWNYEKENERYNWRKYELEGTKAVQVSSQGKSILAIDTEGNLWAYGENTYGQLGNGTTEKIQKIYKIGLLDNKKVEKVILSDKGKYNISIAMAKDEEGNLWKWGKWSDSAESILQPYKIGLIENNKMIDIYCRAGYSEQDNCLVDEVGNVWEIQNDNSLKKVEEFSGKNIKKAVNIHKGIYAIDKNGELLEKENEQNTIKILTQDPESKFYQKKIKEIEGEYYNFIAVDIEEEAYRQEYDLRSM